MMLGTFLLVVAAESVTSTPFDGASVLQAGHQLFLGGTSSPPPTLCMNTCVYASDNYCDSPGSELPKGAYGADCVECAPRMPRTPSQPPVSSPPRPPASTPLAPAAPPALCINTVTRIGLPAYASDGCCDGGGPGAEYPDGHYGTDCADCGMLQPLPTASSPPGKGICLETCDDGGPSSEFLVCAYGTDCVECGSHAVQSSPPPVALPPSSPPRMPPTPGSISADTPSPPPSPPLAPPSAPSPPRSSPPPPCMHPLSPPPSSLPPPQGATPHVHANSASTGRKATALQGEMGRVTCLLSMVVFAMAGLIVSSYGWWGCLQHCFRARCETGRKEHVGVREEGRSRDVLNGESGWLSSSASTGWQALHAKRRGSHSMIRCLVHIRHRHHHRHRQPRRLLLQ